MMNTAYAEVILAQFRSERDIIDLYAFLNWTNTNDCDLSVKDQSQLYSIAKTHNASVRFDRRGEIAVTWLRVGVRVLALLVGMAATFAPVVVL